MDAELQRLRSQLAEIEKQLAEVKPPALVTTVEDARAEREAAQDKADLHRLKSSLLTQIKQREEQLDRELAARSIEAAKERVKAAEEKLEKLADEFNSLSQRQKEIIAEAIEINKKVEPSVVLAYRPREKYWDLSNSMLTKIFPKFRIGFLLIDKKKSKAGDYHIFEIRGEA